LHRSELPFLYPRTDVAINDDHDLGIIALTAKHAEFTVRHDSGNALEGYMKYPKVIDADGHIYENHEEIEEYFEGIYRGMRRARAYPLFPSLDGWPRGLGAGRPDKVTETKPEDVIKFVDNMGLESTVLYPTAGLAIGLVQDPTWAKAISRACKVYKERLAPEGRRHLAASGSPRCRG
jgi:hypothetical protein